MRGELSLSRKSSISPPRYSARRKRSYDEPVAERRHASPGLLARHAEDGKCSPALPAELKTGRGAMCVAHLAEQRIEQLRKDFQSFHPLQASGEVAEASVSVHTEKTFEASMAPIGVASTASQDRWHGGASSSSDGDPEGSLGAFSLGGSPPTLKPAAGKSQAGGILKPAAGVRKTAAPARAAAPTQAPHRGSASDSSSDPSPFSSPQPSHPPSRELSALPARHEPREPALLVLFSLPLVQTQASGLVPVPPVDFDEERASPRWSKRCRWWRGCLYGLRLRGCV